MSDIRPLQRFNTGIPGLDTVLGGGLFVGGIYLVMGPPGAGKTILGNHLAYQHAAEGGRVLYVTLLAESHSWLISNLHVMTFFREEVVGDALQYISGYQALEKEGLDGLTRLLRKLLREQKATLLVIDGFVTADAVAASTIDLKKFVHELQSLVQLVGCTTLLLTGGKEADSSYPERTMVDGLFHLSLRRAGMRTLRELEVEKYRGSEHLMGASFFEISRDGIRIFPRTEATIGGDVGHEEAISALLPTGIATLDAMLGGGLPARSTTLVLGGPGSGKTLLGLHFLAAGAGAGEPSLYFGFFEAPVRLVAKAKAIGIGFAPAMEQGLLVIQRHASQEQLADRLAEKLLCTLHEHGIKRLFIDGLAGFRGAFVHRERFSAFFTSLTNELRKRGVTTLISEMTGFGRESEMRLEEIAAVVETILSFRSVEVSSQQHRLISVKKMREGKYDSSLRELAITDRGLDVSPTLESAERILRGLQSGIAGARATPVKGKAEPSRRRGP